MNSKKEFSQLLSKYSRDIQTREVYNFYLSKPIPDKILKNAKNTFAAKEKNEDILGFYDTTARENGKAGYLFTEDKFFYKGLLSKPIKIWYEDIEKIEIEQNGKEERLYLSLYEEDKKELSSVYINCLPMKSFLEEAKDFVFRQRSKTFSKTEFENSSPDLFGAKAGGYAAGVYGQVNKGFDEEIFRVQQGHGFAAEQANHLHDVLTGKKAIIIGDDNAKNGADRLVDDMYIQTKYHQNASATLSNCFENGKFRYYTEAGQPMQIEVPADQYDAVLARTKDYIQQGKIDGVSDIEDATKIIKKGQFTYQQAKNIAKAGTIESLIYDATNGAIISMSAFGVTAVIYFATLIWHEENTDIALKNAALNGLKVGGTAFATTVFAGQLSKAGLNSALVGSTEAVTTLIGPKASAVLINTFRSGQNIYGAAAMKSAAKLLRNNVITAGLSAVVLSTGDIVSIFRSRISTQQLLKNLTNNAAVIVGSSGGWLAGSALGNLIMPGVGGIIGGLAGSVTSGSVLGKGSNAVLNKYIEDDVDKIIEIIESIFTELAHDYLLSEKEVEKTVDKLSEKLDGRVLQEMYASKDREENIQAIIEPLIENETKRRHKIPSIPEEKMTKALQELLEDRTSDAELGLD